MTVDRLDIVPLAEAHIHALHAIEDVSFPTSWPRDSFERELRDNKVAHYLVAVRGDDVVGFVGAWIVLDEVHITTIAVDPTRRSQHVGRRLLARLLLDGVEKGARWAVLEVRESNVAAIRMYQHFGFRQVGVRKRYYENDENALVLWVGAMQNASFRGLLEQTLQVAGA